MSRPPILLIPLLLGACAVGPRYVAPAPRVAETWVEASPSAAPGAVSGSWWKDFNDPELNALIAAGEANAPDVKIAQARLAEARAGRDAARGAAGPQGSATASGSYNRVSQNGEIPIGHIPGFKPELSLFDAGFDASWEVDLWGGARSAIRAAGARAQAAEACRRDTLARLRAEIARTYLQLRAAQATLDAAQADADAQRASADLARQRLAAGDIARGDADRIEAQARASASAVPAFEGDAREATYSLARLTGRAPEALAAELAVHRPLPVAPARLALGLRSDILRRRPDVAQAERTLAAATADAGAATANLFPRLYLMGAIGQQSQNLSDIALGGSTRFQAGPSVSWPILQRGVIRANIRAANARTAAAAGVYEGAVLGALADSETALNRFVRAGAREAEAAAQAEAARDALAQSQARRSAGEDDQGVLLNARSAAAQARQALIAARLARAVAAVAVYKALGA